jgi:hypothetical protein
MATRNDTVLSLPQWDDLTGFIHRELCEFDRLEASQAPLFRTLLQRGKKPAAVLFHIEGPRLLRTSAVWSPDENRILFYDSTGCRVRTVRLSESPVSAQAA